MTVRQLIETLADLPLDHTVLVWDMGQGNAVPLSEVEAFGEDTWVLNPSTDDSTEVAS
jgi:hypothetical protein